MTAGASGSHSEVPAAASGGVPASAEPIITAKPAKPARTPPVVSESTSRKLFAFDERPQLVDFVTTAGGRVALFACFGILLMFVMPVRLVPIVLAGAAGAAFSKTRRDLSILLATVATLVLEPAWFSDRPFQDYLASFGATESWARNLERLLTAAMFVAIAFALKRVVRDPNSFFARRPVVTLLSVIAVATITGLVLGAFGIASLWLVVAIKLLAVYMWFVCYAVADQRSKQRGSLIFALGLIRPFWGSSSTPIGKGSSYLSKLRAAEPDALARIQLKGLKLLLWSFVLQGLSVLLTTSAARAGVPPLEDVVRSFSMGEQTAIAVGWVAMVVAVAVGALELAVWGHRIVACARLAGFHLRRNTWRPLESRTLADFWNRYYYYFKELLLDFFFYPTFFRVFKKHPRLRTFFATFMAAGVGNAIYHFLRDVDQVFSLGPVLALQGYGSYAFYCLMLASGIAISQVRTGNAPRSNTLGARAWSFLCVWGFVVVIHVFGGVEDRTLGFMTRASFTLHQFGLGT
ncbi:MAG TPA: hypothetical protein VFG30_18165 [Polyangiales bacterium]|nr:hypothetical protein [Polyangiales bacterium]